MRPAPPAPPQDASESRTRLVLRIVPQLALRLAADYVGEKVEAALIVTCVLSGGGGVACLVTALWPTIRGRGTYALVGVGLIALCVVTAAIRAKMHPTPGGTDADADDAATERVGGRYVSVRKLWSAAWRIAVSVLCVPGGLAGVAAGLLCLMTANKKGLIADNPVLVAGGFALMAAGVGLWWLARRLLEGVRSPVVREAVWDPCEGDATPPYERSAATRTIR